MKKKLHFSHVLLFFLAGSALALITIQVCLRNRQEKAQYRAEEAEKRAILIRMANPDCPSEALLETPEGPKVPNCGYGAPVEDYNPAIPLEIYGEDEAPSPQEEKPTPKAPTLQDGEEGASVPYRIGWPGWRQSMVKMAYRLGGWEFVLTLTAENPKWDIWAVGKNNNGTTDHGLCQLNSQYHWAFIASPSFQYWDKQLEYCAEIWHDARDRGRLRTTFYGYNRIDFFVDAYDWQPTNSEG